MLRLKSQGDPKTGRTRTLTTKLPWKCLTAGVVMLGTGILHIIVLLSSTLWAVSTVGFVILQHFEKEKEVTGRCKQFIWIHVLFTWFFICTSAHWSVKTVPVAVCIHCSIIILGKTPWGGLWTAMPFSCISASSSDLISKTNLTRQCLWRF